MSFDIKIYLACIDGCRRAGNLEALLLSAYNFKGASPLGLERRHASPFHIYTAALLTLPYSPFFQVRGERGT